MNGPFDHTLVTPVTSWPFGRLVPLKYRLVVLDPPWKYSMGTKSRPQHYKRMTDTEIAALPLRALAHPEGCWFAVWTTGPIDGPRFWENIWPGWKAQGLRYSSLSNVWIKTLADIGDDGTLATDGLAVSTGFTTRKTAEFVKLFKIGKPKVQAHDVLDVIFARRREHSRKPDEFYEAMTRLVPGPYAAVFEREERPGFDCCGDELGKFPSEIARSSNVPRETEAAE